jgi:hypothetical protein
VDEDYAHLQPYWPFAPSFADQLCHISRLAGGGGICWVGHDVSTMLVGREMMFSTKLSAQVWQFCYRTPLNDPTASSISLFG